jgi:hypothetical protein
MTVYEPNADQLKELLALTEVKFRSSRLAIKIFSEFLESEIYLVSDPSLASEVDGVAYTPEEVKALGTFRKSQATWTFHQVVQTCAFLVQSLCG